MTYKAHIKNGVAVIEGGVTLPEGTEVLLEPITPSQSIDGQSVSMYDRFSDLIDSNGDLPSDAARHKRHYLYGHRKS